MTKTETGEHLRFSDQLSDWKYLGGTLCSDEISKAAHSKKKKKMGILEDLIVPN